MKMKKDVTILHSSVEKRKAVLINAAYIVLLLGAAFLFMRYAFWLFAPFIFAFFFAAALQRPVNFVVRKTPIKRKGVVSVLFVLLACGLLAAVVTVIGARLVSEFRGLVSYIMDRADDLPEFIKSVESSLLGLIAKLPAGLRDSLSSTVSNFVDKLLLSSEARDAAAQAQASTGTAGFDLLSLIATPLSGIWSTAKQIPGVLVGVLVGIVACCFVTSDYDRLANFVKRQFSPEKRRTLSRAKRVGFATIGKFVKSYALIMFITFCEMCVGLFTLRVIGVYNGSYIIAIAIITALVDILPVLGTGTILLPWGVFCLITSNFGLGVGLLILYICILVIRQIIEPKIVADNLGLPPIATIMGMYIGLQLFGVIGLFLLPMTITILKVLNDEGIIRLWKTGSKPKGDSSETSETATQKESQKENKDEKKVEHSVDGQKNAKGSDKNCDELQ